MLSNWKKCGFALQWNIGLSALVIKTGVIRDDQVMFQIHSSIR